VDPITQACGDQPGWVCEQVYEATNNQFLAELANWLVRTPLQILLIALGAFIVNRITRRVISHFLHGLSVKTASVEGLLATTAGVRTPARLETLGAVLRSVASGVIYGIAFLMILGQTGVDLGPLIAGAGIAGIALGFGAQSLVKDFLSGFFVLVEDQYGVGDVVDLDLAAGTVEAVSLRTTRVRSLDGTVWHVPNGQIVRVGNRSQEWTRGVLDVTIASDADLVRAQQIMRETAEALVAEDRFSGDVIESPEVYGVEGFEGGVARIRLAIKTRPAADVPLLRELRVRERDALSEAGIPLAVPITTPTA
jgi:small conductance mechanosensitive channel